MRRTSGRLMSPVVDARRRYIWRGGEPELEAHKTKFTACSRSLPTVGLRTITRDRTAVAEGSTERRLACIPGRCPRICDQRWFLIADHKQVEAYCHRNRVLEQWQREEQPGFAKDDQERGDVNGITNPAIRTHCNKSERRIPWPPVCRARRRRRPRGTRNTGRLRR